MPGMVQEGNVMLRVKILIGCQVIRDCGRRFVEHIRHDGIKRHIADGKSVLETVLLAAFHRSEFVTVTCQFPQNTNILGRNKTAFHQTDAKQVSYPFGVFGVVLISFHSLDPFWVGDDDTNASLFQNVEYRHPVFPGGFHTHIQAAILVKPISKAVQFGIEHRKSLLLVFWLQVVLWRFDDGSHQKRFVNVNPAASWKHNFQTIPSS